MNRTTFLAYARRAPFGGRLTLSQIDGMNAILDELDRRQSTAKVIDNRWLAHKLATVFHETGGTLQPVIENLNYSGERLIKVWLSRFPKIASATAQAGEQGLRRPDEQSQAWRRLALSRRGLPQITGPFSLSRARSRGFFECDRWSIGALLPPHGSRHNAIADVGMAGSAGGICEFNRLLIGHRDYLDHVQQWLQEHQK